MIWGDRKIHEAQKRIAALEQQLAKCHENKNRAYMNVANKLAAVAAWQARCADMKEALDGLLDGLDSNNDERCGLTQDEWDQRIRLARANTIPGLRK